MKKLFLLVGFIIACSSISHVSAQDYKSAIGGKLGFGLVASYKTFLNERNALDIFGGIHWGDGFLGGVNYSMHKPIESVDRLKWYWGFGANMFTWGAVTGFDNWYELGVSGNIGLDYSFDEFPLNLSVDYVPTIVILENDDFDRFSRTRWGYGALTARYILGSKK